MSNNLNLTLVLLHPVVTTMSSLNLKDIRQLYLLRQLLMLASAKMIFAAIAPPVVLRTPYEKRVLISSMSHSHQCLVKVLEMVKGEHHWRMMSVLSTPALRWRLIPKWMPQSRLPYEMQQSTHNAGQNFLRKLCLL